MKTIEEIIINNREALNAEPPEGHFERFSVKLELRKKIRKPTVSIVSYIMKVAAVALLVILSSLYTWDNFIRNDSGRMTLGEVSPQYREVENYYVNQVNLMENEISASAITIPGQKEALLKELQNMDTIYVALQKDLKANPNNETVINAMIEHYEKKLDVMTIIVNQLKAIRNSNNNKNKEYEKVSL
ncbi:MAG: hypothetical protein LBV26_06600 [Bacteroidales bacterium]|jgi:hypothetical protein|nr:hypothetical protein [Bacteroidales bacterium]